MKKVKKILIIGNGFGGIYTIKSLAKYIRPQDNIEISLIADENYFLFTPLLHEVATGSVDADHIVEPIREILGHRLKELHIGKAEKINTKERTVKVGEALVPYDYLVIAPGGETNFFNTPGAEENSLALKNLNDAIKVKNTIIEKIEGASLVEDSNERRKLLSFVIVGGGPTGVELAAEMSEFIKVSMARYYSKELINDTSITLVQSGSELLGQFDKRVRIKSLNVLRKKGVQVLLDTRVKEVLETSVKINDDIELNSGTTLWVAGIKPSFIDFDIDVEKTKNGKLLVNKYLQLEGLENIFAIGDAAAYGNEETGYLPALAQVAEKQAEAVAQNVYLATRELGIDLHPFIYKSKGSMISLGQWMAVAEISRFVFSGHVTWWLWRTLYLSKMISTRKKFKIVLDWTIGIFRPRDISKI